MDKLNSMQAFLQVSRLGSFSAAAKEMGLSKAMVSKHISNLENSLGAQLLNRTTRKLSLTEVGMVYRDQIKDILNDIEETELAISSLSSEPRGSLRMIAPTSFGSFHLTKAIADYRKIYQDVSFDLILTERIPDLVEEGLDLAICVGELEDSSMVAIKLAEVRTVICASPEYLQQHGRPLQPKDLNKHNCLIYTPFKDAEEWSFYVNGEIEKVNVTGSMRSNASDALRVAAIQGVGIIHLPTYVVGLDIQASRLESLLVDFEGPCRPIYAVYQHRRHLSAKVRTFVDFLINRFQPVPYWEEWTR